MCVCAVFIFLFEMAPLFAMVMFMTSRQHLILKRYCGRMTMYSSPIKSCVIGSCASVGQRAYSMELRKHHLHSL